MHILRVSREEKALALQANIYFDHLEGEQLDHLAACTSLREYGRGETLFFENDPCAGLHIVQKGYIKLYRLSPQGRQYIVRLAQDGDTFNEVAVFDNGTNPVHAEALETSRIWIVEAECLRTMVSQNAEFACDVIFNLSQNLRMLVQAASEMAFYQVTHRLARLISSAAEGELVSGGTGMTQEQLAARLGTVREVVARSLRELERAGAIQIRNRRIHIADAKVLEQWTQGPWN